MKMCDAWCWFCHTWIFSLGIEALILGLFLVVGAVVNALVCRIWGEADEEGTTVERSMTMDKNTISKAA